MDLDGLDNISGTADDEECDDGNNTNGDWCSDTCKNAFCGDGILSPISGEQCDL